MNILPKTCSVIFPATRDNTDFERTWNLANAWAQDDIINYKGRSCDEYEYRPLLSTTADIGKLSRHQAHSMAEASSSEMSPLRHNYHHYQSSHRDISPSNENQRPGARSDENQRQAARVDENQRPVPRINEKKPFA